MVGLTRLELVTPRLSSVCSNQLSYRPSDTSMKNNLLWILTNRQSFVKEVIQPQVPLRLPCYDFALLKKPRFEYNKKNHILIQALFGWRDGRCVQGAGTYSPRDYDTRLLRIPAS